MSTAEPFDLQKHIPSELWDLFDETGGDEGALGDRLRELPRALFVQIFEGLVEARVELVDRLVSSGRVKGASEDTLDDLADSLAFSGKRIYEAALVGTSELPAEEGWHKLPGATSVFCRVFWERFGADIYDELDL